MSRTRYATRNLKFTTLNDVDRSYLQKDKPAKPKKCSKCKTLMPINLPYVICVDSGGDNTTPTFLMCYLCIETLIQDQLLPLINQVSEEVIEKFTTERIITNL